MLLLIAHCAGMANDCNNTIRTRFDMQANRGDSFSDTLKKDMLLKIAFFHKVKSCTVLEGWLTSGELKVYS